MNREEKLRLLQRAYAIWLERCPEGNMAQVNCHLPEIQASLGLPKEITGFDEKVIEKP